MVRVFHSLPRLRDATAFDSWLRQIVTNTAHSHVAAEQREREKASRFRAYDRDRSEVEDMPGPAPEDDFNALISGLRLEERTLLAFRLVEELPYPVIAHILGITESAAKMRYRRAIEQLRRQLDPP